MPAPIVFRRDLATPQPVAVRGAGMYVEDGDGKRYLDGVGGIAVNIIGHAVPEITRDLHARREELSFTYGAVFTNPWQEELARRLVDMSPFDRASAYLVSGGSEANEVAIKFARQYHLERGQSSKWKIVSRWEGYHGNTLATSAVSGRPSWRHGFDPYFVTSPKVSAPYAYRAPAEVDHGRLVDYWIDEFRQLLFHEDPRTVAAFIAEPVIGTSLVGVVPPPGYYEGIRQVCDENDVLFIADEVLAGYGRTGKNFSIEHWDALPDMITAGKGVGSGYAPLAACILSGAVADTIADGSGKHTQGFTYSGNALASYIGVQVNDYVNEHRLIERSAELGGYLQAQLRELAESTPAIGDVRGKGLLGGIELVSDRCTKQPYPEERGVAAGVVAECAAQGVLVAAGPRGTLLDGGDLLQISPAYIVERAEIDRIVDVLGTAISIVVAG